MEEPDFSGSFINLDNTNDNDILVIVSEPVASEQESPTEKVIINNVIKPKKFITYSCDVEKDGMRKTFKIDNKTGMRFQKAWGKKKEWVGKTFKAKVEDYKAFGVDKKRIAGFPIESEKQ